MALHIMLMGVAAPILAWMLPGLLPNPLRRSLVTATIVQLALIWGWHAPFALEFAMQSPWLHAAMQASLFGASLWFWSAIFAVTGARRWRPIVALLVTGKLFCLLGILFAFSPRLLYAVGSGAAHRHGQMDLMDQQLAGLMMIVACPATYVLAAVVIASRWLLAMEPGSIDGRNA